MGVGTGSSGNGPALCHVVGDGRGRCGVNGGSVGGGDVTVFTAHFSGLPVCDDASRAARGHPVAAREYVVRCGTGTSGQGTAHPFRILGRDSRDEDRGN